MRAALRAAVLAAALASEASEAPLPPEPTSPPGACYVHLQECDGHPTGEWFAVDPVSGQPARRLSEATAAFVWVEKDGNTVCEDHGLHNPNTTQCSEAAAERGVDFGTFPHGPQCHLYNGKVYYNPNGDLPLGNSPPLCNGPTPQPAAASAPSPGLRFIADPGSFTQRYSHTSKNGGTTCNSLLRVQNLDECRQVAAERGTATVFTASGSYPACFQWSGSSFFFNTGTTIGSQGSATPFCRIRPHSLEGTNTICSSEGLDDLVNEAECRQAATDRGKTFGNAGTYDAHPRCHIYNDKYYWSTAATQGASSVSTAVCRKERVRSCVPVMGPAGGGASCSSLSLYSPNDVTECYSAAINMGYGYPDPDSDGYFGRLPDSNRYTCFESNGGIYYNNIGDTSTNSVDQPLCCKAQYVTGNVGETCTESGYMDVESVGDCRAAANDVNGLAFTSLFDGSNPTAQRCTKNGDTVAYWYNYNADAGVASAYASHKPVCRNIPAAPTTCGCTT